MNSNDKPGDQGRVPPPIPPRRLPIGGPTPPSSPAPGTTTAPIYSASMFSSTAAPASTEPVPTASSDTPSQTQNQSQNPPLVQPQAPTGPTAEFQGPCMQNNPFLEDLALAAGGACTGSSHVNESCAGETQSPSASSAAQPLPPTPPPMLVTVAVGIEVRDEEGKPDAVEIDKADDEEESSPLPLSGQNVVGRTASAGGVSVFVPTILPSIGVVPSTAAQPTASTIPIIRSRIPPTNVNPGAATNGIVGGAAPVRVGVEVGVRSQPISQRLLQRRNSENALQHAYVVAAKRKETLLRLLNEHDQLVREVERWSSVASVETEGTGSPARSASMQADCGTLGGDTIIKSHALPDAQDQTNSVAAPAPIPVPAHAHPHAVPAGDSRGHGLGGLLEEEGSIDLE